MKKLINSLIFSFPFFIRIFLVNIIFSFKNVLNFLKYRKKSYSQFGEDKHLQELLMESEINNKRYLDIGCYHPTYLSNTHMLYIDGWSGVGVDLSKEKIDYFVKKRKGTVKGLVTAIVPDESDEKSFKGYFFKKIWSEIDTLSKEVANKKREELGYEFYEKDVATTSINNLLRDHGPFEFMNIDIEGLDEIVIENMNMQLAPNIILFESNVLDHDSKYIKRLKNSNYEHKFTTHISHCFMRKNKS